MGCLVLADYRSKWSRPGPTGGDAGGMFILNSSRDRIITSGFMAASGMLWACEELTG